MGAPVLEGEVHALLVDVEGRDGVPGKLDHLVIMIIMVIMFIMFIMVIKVIMDILIILIIMNILVFVGIAPNYDLVLQLAIVSTSMQPECVKGDNRYNLSFLPSVCTTVGENWGEMK